MSLTLFFVLIPFSLNYAQTPPVLAGSVSCGMFVGGYHSSSTTPWPVVYAFNVQSTPIILSTCNSVIDTILITLYYDNITDIWTHDNEWCNAEITGSPQGQCDACPGGSNERWTIDFLEPNTNYIKIDGNGDGNYQLQMECPTPTPTTNTPTTAIPTTAIPTTNNPTTGIPTTATPTTNNPTEIPTTYTPTTATPTTYNPTTNNPTTFIPTTATPTIQDPTTHGKEVIETTDFDKVDNFDLDDGKNSWFEDNLWILFVVIGVLFCIIVIITIIVCHVWIKKHKMKVLKLNVTSTLSANNGTTTDKLELTNINKTASKVEKMESCDLDVSDDDIDDMFSVPITAGNINSASEAGSKQDNCNGDDSSSVNEMYLDHYNTNDQTKGTSADCD